MVRDGASRPRTSPARARLLLAAALIGSWLVFCAGVLWLPDRARFVFVRDAVLYNVPFVLAGLACAWRALREDRERPGWVLFGAGFVVFIGGNCYGTLVIGDQDIYPSAADALWLIFYVFVYAALIQLVKARSRRFLASLWLDGAVGGLGAAALATALVLQPVLEVTQGSLPVVVTNLAYPVADLLLIVVMITVWTVMGARNLSWWLIAAGVVLFCVGDIRFLVEESMDAYVEGGPLDTTWPASGVLFGLAALVGGRTGSGGALTRPYLVPATFSATSVALLVYGQGRTLPTAAVGLAVASLGGAAVRVWMTVREVAALAVSRHEARTDELTGLANRRRLTEVLAGQLVEGDRDGQGRGEASLLVIDLDRFKEVNDTLGHAAGDELLQAVSARIAPLVPPPGLIARLGGDEFSVVLPGSGMPAAEQLARHLLAALEAPFSVAGTLVPVEASIGVASAPADATTADTLMSCADGAMYRAKRNRTGVECFHASLDRPSVGRMALLAQVRTALQEDQFTLWYQPQLDLGSGRVCGVEALIRWPHPEQGLIPPDQFLPVVEQSTLMSSVTAFVLDRALSDCALLHRAGFGVRVSVNVSASDLIDSRLPQLVRDELDRHRIEPDWLVLEVTEDTVLADRSRALQVLYRLRENGVRISVDDYGTGHSSLSYLRDLPITEIKLDRTFLQGVPHDTHNAAIVRSTVELAHALDLPIVSEGVQDDAALAWLAEIGCDLGQGYHICMPLPLPDLLAWLETSGRRSGLGLTAR